MKKKEAEKIKRIVDKILSTEPEMVDVPFFGEHLSICLSREEYSFVEPLMDVQTTRTYDLSAADIHISITGGMWPCTLSSNETTYICFSTNEELWHFLFGFREFTNLLLLSYKKIPFGELMKPKKISRIHANVMDEIEYAKEEVVYGI